MRAENRRAVSTFLIILLAVQKHKCLLTADVTPPPIGERSTVMRVSVCLCVFVCPRSYLRNYTSDLHQMFCACYLWPGCGPPLAAW